MKLTRYLPISQPGFFAEERKDFFLSLAAEFNGSTVEGITAKLEAGQTVYYDAEWYAKLQDGEVHDRIIAERQAKRKPSKLCGCGHYSDHPMMGNFGTVCPNCYDKK